MLGSLNNGCRTEGSTHRLRSYRILQDNAADIFPSLLHLNFNTLLRPNGFGSVWTRRQCEEELTDITYLNAAAQLVNAINALLGDYLDSFVRVFKMGVLIYSATGPQVDRNDRRLDLALLAKC